MSNEVLLIDITAVNAAGRPTTFSKNAASNATGAVVNSDGSIDLTNCAANISISWTFAASTGEKFSGTNGITFSPGRGTPGNDGVFSAPVLSNGNLTATIMDYNPDAASRGSNQQVFNYTVHDTPGLDDDPSIRNR